VINIALAISSCCGIWWTCRLLFLKRILVVY